MPDVPSLREADSGNGHTVVYAGRQFYDRNSPIKAAGERAQRSVIPPDSLVLVDSPLLGYGLDEILAKLTGRAWVLAVEYDQKLMALSLSHIGPGILRDPRIQVVRAESAEAVVSFLDRHGLRGVRRAVRVSLSGSGRLYPAFYRDVQHRVEATIQEYWQNRATLIRLGNTWIKNLIANLPEIDRARSPLDLHPFTAALVVGAGPSSERLYQLHRQVPANVAVFAVDTALPILEAAGIRCDVVVAVEAQWPNMLDFVGLARHPTNAFLDLTGLPATGRHLGDSWREFFLSRFANTRLVDRLQAAGVRTIPALGSVGIVTAYLARESGFRHVATVGFDFAYPPGKPHARGAPTHRRHLTRCCRTAPMPNYRIGAGHIRRPGKRGTSVNTDMVLSSYAGLMAELAGSFEVFLDCSETGLPLGVRTATHIDVALETLAEVPRDKPHDSPAREAPGPGTTEPMHSATEIVAAEALRLRRLVDTLGGQPGTAAAEQTLPGGDLDYVTLAFPDCEDLDPDDTATRRRIEISARYFLDLWTQAERGRPNTQAKEV